MSNRMGMILKGVPYKMQPNIITHLSYFYFFQRYQECHKQCDITADAVSVPSAPVSSKNNGPTIYFQGRSHQKQIFTNADDFHAVHISFQHSIFYRFDY
jgi:hypothetical protein